MEPHKFPSVSPRAPRIAHAPSPSRELLAQARDTGLICTIEENRTGEGLRMRYTSTLGATVFSSAVQGAEDALPPSVDREKGRALLGRALSPSTDTHSAGRSAGVRVSTCTRSATAARPTAPGQAHTRRRSSALKPPPPPPPPTSANGTGTTMTPGTPPTPPGCKLQLTGCRLRVADPGSRNPPFVCEPRYPVGPGNEGQEL